jgi:hypothetical protein
METARKQHQNNRFEFSMFYGACCSIEGRVFRFLPHAVYVVYSSETSEQTADSIQYRNLKGCHHQNKSYQFRWYKKRGHSFCSRVLFTMSSANTAK